MAFQSPGAAFGSSGARSVTSDAPLVVIFERDDTLAVPLLSQLRLAGYDVRSARTPVELFDTAQKHAVALMLVDLGNAAAGRREFWVALDAQRRGRAIQVLTYRVLRPDSILDTELDVTASALADVELRGAQDLQMLVDAVRQRVPLHGGAPLGGSSMPPLGQSAAFGPGMPDGNGGPTNGFGPPATGSIYGPAGAGPWGASSYDLSAPAPMATSPSFSPFATPPGGLAPSAPDQQSPFAHPASENPFAGTGPGSSPFSQPFSGNPFAAADAPGATASMGVMGVPGGHAGHANPPSPIADAWVPPSTGGLNGSGRAPASAQPAVIRPLVQGAAPTAPRAPERPRGADLETGERGFPTYDTALGEEDLFGRDDPRLHDATAPVSAQMPAVPGALTGQAERALGTVLVEGALLSPRKLEVLKEIQRMLSGVDLDFKLGELALVFKFLSPDQLLAALLVSRGLVTPQQIAGLGRIKQELSASGMDYDLETLLVMFHVLPADKLREIRRELA